MAKFTTLEEFEVYQDSLGLVIKIMDLCKTKQLSKDYWLVDQIKRATCSIPANISEGYGRFTKKDFAYFLSISLGSANELRALLDILTRMDIEKDSVAKLKEEVVAMCKRLYSFRKKLLTVEPRPRG